MVTGGTNLSQIEDHRGTVYCERVIPVNQFLPSALADILRKAPLTPEKVAFAWRSAVGPAVDKVTTIALRNGILHVHAREAAWGREIERSAAVVRMRLDTLLGPGVVRYIEVTATASGSPAAPATAAPHATATGAAAPARSADRSADESGTGRRRR